jgi:oligoendopeptidase F
MTPGGLLSSDLAFMFENYLGNLPNDLFPKDKLIDALKIEYKSVGIDLDKLPIETVIQDIPAGGFCFTFDPGKDTRILANPRDGQMWYQVLFHEFGHAVHGSTAKGDGRYLVALSDPGFFWEGVAVLFEKLAMRDHFLTKYIGDTEKIKEFRHGAKARLAYRIRRLSLAGLFEYSLYLEPASYENLQKRLADTAREYLLVEPANDPPTFTHDIFHITHPCYIQNYVLAEMMAYQILGASEAKGDDPWTEDFANRVVQNLLIPGGLVRWVDKIEGFTGKPMGPDAMLKNLK